MNQSQALIQALEAVGYRHPLGRGECLWQTLQHLRPLAGVTSRAKGLAGSLAARVTLHNFCIWLNEQLGRPPLAFADLLQW